MAYKVTQRRPASSATAAARRSSTTPRSTRASGSPPRSSAGCSSTSSTNKRDRTATIKQLLQTRELWFVPVVNPDGYDYTFVDKGTRLWRKNLRDVNGGGVQPGRRRRRHQPQLADELELRPRGRLGRPVERDLPRLRPGLGARGPGDARAREAHEFKFSIDYHSFAQLILYPEGWQVETPATDCAADGGAGRRRRQPGGRRASTPTSRPSSTRPTATSPTTPAQRSARRPTRSSSTAAPGRASAAPSTGRTRSPPAASSSRTPRPTSQAEFQKNLAFALDLARSAGDPDEPELAPGQHRAGLRADDVPDLLRRPADRRGQRQAVARRGAASYWQVNGGARARRRRPSSRAASAVRRPGDLLPPHARQGRRARRRATASRCGSTRRARRSRTRSPTRSKNESPTRCC